MDDLTASEESLTAKKSSLITKSSWQPKEEKWKNYNSLEEKFPDDLPKEYRKALKKMGIKSKVLYNATREKILIEDMILSTNVLVPYLMEIIDFKVL